MSTTHNDTGAHSALAPQAKALRVATILRERLGIDCLAAELLESQHARIVEMEAIAALASPAQQAVLDEVSKEQYARMFGAACEALGQISDHLGIDSDINPGAEPIIEAIDELRAAAQQAPASQDAPIVWPKARDVGRIGDMSRTASLRVGLDGDNDTYVGVWDENGGGSIEFCTPGAGGGKSSRTRVALLALMVAMEADNAEDPCRDWWALRNGHGDAALATQQAGDATP